MPICCFNREYSKKYKCEYDIKDDYIEVIVEYEIVCEIEPINGYQRKTKRLLKISQYIICYK